jgi:hypothetical protein
MQRRSERLLGIRQQSSGLPYNFRKHHPLPIANQVLRWVRVQPYRRAHSMAVRMELHRDSFPTIGKMIHAHHVPYEFFTGRIHFQSAGKGIVAIQG